MLRLSAALIVLAAAYWTPAAAQQSYESCADLADKTLRLDCFDRAARDNKPAEKASKNEEQPADTKAMTAPAPPTEFKLVDAEDMFVSPNKFKDKGVELRRVQCFYADKEDYRCLAPGASVVMVQSIEVRPAAARDKLENECGSIKVVFTPKCRRTIRFVPNLSQEDQVNAFQKKQSFGTLWIEVVPGR